ncbi:MAG: hypothetical protein ACOCQD_05345 [archaeon]
MKKSDILGYMLVIGISVILITLIISEVLFPAWLSFSAVCMTNYFNKTYGEDYTTAGSTQEVVDPETNETSIEIELIAPDDGTKKHEYCHYVQRQAGILSFSCEKPIQKYLSEVECYAVEHYPDWLFERIYGDYKGYYKMERMM